MLTQNFMLLFAIIKNEIKEEKLIPKFAVIQNEISFYKFFFYKIESLVVNCDAFQQKNFMK